MGAARKGIIWSAARRHAASAHECRLKARRWGAAFPEHAAAADLDADKWERALIADLTRLDEIHALPAAIDAVLQNKESVKKILAAGSLDGVELRYLDIVSLELVVANIRATLVEMVLQE